jgi:hypothetical protein
MVLQHLKVFYILTQLTMIFQGNYLILFFISMYIKKIKFYIQDQYILQLKKVKLKEFIKVLLNLMMFAIQLLIGKIMIM